MVDARIFEELIAVYMANFESTTNMMPQIYVPTHLKILFVKKKIVLLVVRKSK